MKTSNILILATLVMTLTQFTLCTKEDTIEEYSYSYNNNYVRDTILYHIDLGTLGTRHIFVINENEISESELNNKISSIKKEDIISITILNKTDAIEIYGTSANYGVVKLNYYIDPLLKPVYYITDNTEIMGIIEDLISQGKVVRFPLIVLDGKPLRGLEIEEYLDKLNNESIKSILTMELKSGLQLYGERAINGVVIINTLY